ncbi:MAG: RadC family protein [Minwuia sp.]|uniref:RadC family protein n=1 Tax=Minwuia sp. TaxID=2493630 RepID=UPI003A8B8172
MAEGSAKPHYHGHRSRMREKLIAHGPDALQDYELLEMALWAASPRGDTKPLAKQLIETFGDFAHVISAPPERLKEVPGVGDAAIAQIKLLDAAAVRLARARVMKRNVLSSWQALIDYCNASKRYKTTEEFHVLFLDRKNVLIADEVQQKGTVDHTPVYPREIVKRALHLEASALIMVHNHPSGDPTPSRADIDMTKQVRDAAKAVGVVLHDHLVVGADEPYSFRSNGLL